MKSKNQSGFSAVFIVLTIILIASVAGAGFYVNQKNNEKATDQKVDQLKITNFEECAEAGNPIMDSYPEQCSADGQTFRRVINSKFTLDEASVPKGWHILFNEAEIASLDNSAIDRKPEESCSVEVKNTVDESVKATTAETDRVKLYEAKTSAAKDAKGYTYQKLDDAKLELNARNGEIIIPSFYAKIIGPAAIGADSVQYQKNAYLVATGSYVEITQSCGSQNFAEADKALSAIKFE